MAGSNGRTPEQVRHEIETEREQLAHAVETLRTGLGEAADVRGKLKANLPAVAAAAAGVGFFLAGGVGATMRYFARRSREGSTEARVGRFRIVDRG